MSSAAVMIMGEGATRAQQAAQSADIYGFLRWQAAGRAR